MFRCYSRLQPEVSIACNSLPALYFRIQFAMLMSYNILFPKNIFAKCLFVNFIKIYTLGCLCIVHCSVNQSICMFLIRCLLQGISLASFAASRRWVSSMNSIVLSSSHYIGDDGNSMPNTRTSPQHHIPTSPHLHIDTQMQIRFLVRFRNAFQL